MLQGGNAEQLPQLFPLTWKVSSTLHNIVTYPFRHYIKII